MDVGTLSELNVQVGDVVEWVGEGANVVYTIASFDGKRFRTAGMHEYQNLSETELFRIVSRAAPPLEEITWGPWGEFDPSHSLTDDVLWRQVNGEKQWSYPVKRKPVVETRFGYWSDRDGCSQWVGQSTHRITMTIIDGVVQPTATVEVLA